MPHVPAHGDLAVSIVITNFEYAELVPVAIESALSQTHPKCEVIVVDDGSRDNSREVLRDYAGRVQLVFKENGGHASAFNAGFLRTKGELVIFLDADDELAVEAAATVVRCYQPEISKYQWYLETIDREGRSTGGRVPDRPAEGGDLAERVLAHGPRCYVCPPTSGNAWSRAFLSRVMPLPEIRGRGGAEPYLMDTAPLFGTVLTVDQVLARYRIHDGSMGSIKRGLAIEGVEEVVAADRTRAEFLAAQARALKLEVPPDLWYGRDWRVLLGWVLLAKAGKAEDCPSARSLVGSALAGARRFPYRLLLAAFLLTIRVSPERPAFALAGRVLTPYNM